MVIKSVIISFNIAALSAYLLINSACHKLCVANHYIFNIDNCIIQPDKDNINVGDTLFFTSITSTTMVNQSDGRSINYSSADNLGSVLGVAELIGTNSSNDAVNSFLYIPMKGRIYTDPTLSPNRVKQLNYIEESGYYKLSFAVVAQRKGVYGLSIADMPDVVRNCDRSVIAMKISENVDSHLHYLRDIYYGGGPINSLDSTHAYCFKVY